MARARCCTPVGDARALAAALERTHRSALRARLRAGGREVVERLLVGGVGDAHERAYVGVGERGAVNVTGDLPRRLLGDRRGARAHGRGRRAASRRRRGRRLHADRAAVRRARELLRARARPRRAQARHRAAGAARRASSAERAGTRAALRPHRRQRHAPTFPTPSSPSWSSGRRALLLGLEHVRHSARDRVPSRTEVP